MEIRVERMIHFGILDPSKYEENEINELLSGKSFPEEVYACFHYPRKAVLLFEEFVATEHYLKMDEVDEVLGKGNDEDEEESKKDSTLISFIFSPKSKTLVLVASSLEEIFGKSQDLIPEKKTKAEKVAQGS